jgi:hypothetical protein
MNLENISVTNIERLLGAISQAESIARSRGNSLEADSLDLLWTQVRMQQAVYERREMIVR